MALWQQRQVALIHQKLLPLYKWVDFNDQAMHDFKLNFSGSSIHMFLVFKSIYQAKFQLHGIYIYIYICHIFMSLIVVDVKTPTPGSDHKQASPTFSFSLVEARSPLPQVPTEAWHWLFQLCLQEIRMRWE